jgi:hypothetical protein
VLAGLREDHVAAELGSGTEALGEEEVLGTLAAVFRQRGGEAEIAGSFGDEERGGRRLV